VLEEKPEVGGHGVVPIQQVPECRSIRAGRVRSLQRLIELLRIAKEDDAFRGAAHGENVRQRHLPGLVHEQYVEQAIAPLRSP
jgi:hypothetical protein